MARPKSPLRAWLMLFLPVLMLHLALLHALPLSLDGAAPDMAAPSFTTRTLAPEPIASRGAAASPAKRKSNRPIAKILMKPAPKTEANTGTAASVVTPAAGSDPPPEPPTPERLAAAPPEAAPAPEPIPAPRPAREQAPRFQMEGLPGSVKLVYKVEANKFPYSLNGELLWTQTGNDYLASLSFGAFGQTRTQTSRGQIGKHGLAPERFSDKFRSEVAAHFNRDHAKITFSANTPDAPLLSGAQDRLSVLIQLAALVASAPDHYDAGTTLTIQTIGPRDADLWLFTVGKLEVLTLPGGTVQGLKLTRNPRQLYEQRVDIWLAPQLGYLPARIRITEANGDYIDQKWASSEPASTP